jgi:Fe2+ or Zn2+ uptake regulation protein
MASWFEEAASRRFADDTDRALGRVLDALTEGEHVRVETSGNERHVLKAAAEGEVDVLSTPKPIPNAPSVNATEADAICSNCGRRYDLQLAKRTLTMAGVCPRCDPGPS